MKVLFDSSALVAALLRKHPRHVTAFSQLQAVHFGSQTGVLTTHGLAELFATLSAIPLRPRLQPTEVQSMIERSILPHFELFPLGADIYRQAIALTVRRGLSSGAVYDALHLIGARESGCAKLFTFNLRHFQALAPEDPMIVQPR